MHKVHKLKSGIRVILIPKKDTEVVTVACGFGVGSRHEQEHEHGISHFLEHMIYKGAKRRKTTKEVSEYIDSIGASHNAFTGKEYTGFYLKVSAKNLEKAVDILSDNITFATLEKEEIDKERGPIIEEIDMHEDIPFDKVTDTIESALYSKSPLAKDISGTKKIVRSISRQELQDYKKRHYCKDNMVLVVAGKYDECSDKELLEIIDKYFEELPEKSEKKDGFCQKHQRVMLFPKNIEQTNFIYAKKGPSEESEDKYFVRILTKILAGSMSSRLYKTIREELGLVYAIEGFTSSYSDEGSIQIYAGLDKKNISLALSELNKEIDKMVEKGVTAQELNKAKEIIITKMLINQEDSASQAFDYLTSLLVGSKIETPEEKIKKYKAVKLEDVNKVAKKYLVGDTYLSAVGPGLDKEKITKITTK